MKRVKGRTGWNVSAFFQGANGRVLVGEVALMGISRCVIRVGWGVPM